MTRRLLAATAAALAFHVTGPARAGAQENTKEAYHWAGRVDAGRWMRIVNLNGSITFGAASGDNVEVVATEHWRHGDPSVVRFDLQQGGADGGDITVCALWGTRARCDSRASDEHDDHPERNNDLTVDFQVLVPRGVRVGASGVNGSILVQGVTGEINASTVNGTIELTAVGVPIEASTVNGSIKAHVSRVVSSMSFHAVNGNLVIDLPAETAADVELSTVTGSLKSDYDMTVSGRLGGQNVSGHIGRPGGPLISLTTVNGSVELRRG